MQAGGVGPAATAYWATAGLILVSSIIENSYLLAYHDELTTLPARRAFNDALLHLEEPYAIAVVDIDHFKKFNDTYGHETGDQVLRLVAAKLASVSGGGRAYRVGGEEFSILFPGKSVKDALPHLEQLRAAIGESRFRVRAGEERRSASRSPDLRGQHSPDHDLPHPDLRDQDLRDHGLRDQDLRDQDLRGKILRASITTGGAQIAGPKVAELQACGAELDPPASFPSCRIETSRSPSASESPNPDPGPEPSSRSSSPPTKPCTAPNTPAATGSSRLTPNPNAISRDKLKFRRERWQSGRMRRFAKPLYWLIPVPRVRIPPSPPVPFACNGL